MKEENIKTKWCPFAQICLIPTQSTEIQVCAGSNCAMWRWKNIDKTPAGTIIYSDQDGYCGLAGKE